MKIKITAIIMILAFCSCTSTNNQNNTVSKKNNEIVINVKTAPILKNLENTQEIFLFKESNNPNTIILDLEDYCSSLMKDYGYSSMVIDATNENSVLYELMDDLNSIVYVTLIYEENAVEQLDQFFIAMYSIDMTNIETDETLNFIPIWVGSAAGTRDKFESIESRNKIAELLLTYYTNKSPDIKNNIHEL